MNNPGKLVVLVFLILAGIAVWLGITHLRQPGAPAGLTGEGLSALPPFSYPDVEGNLRASEEWSDKILVINFWATWCPPCREEMPLFVDSQTKYGAKGVQFIGIAIDDRDIVRDFADVYGINFPILIGSTEAIELANQLGNRFNSLPFTAIFDRLKQTTYTQGGQISRERLEQELEKLL